MGDDNSKSEVTTPDNFWADGTVDEMAGREYYHLQAAEELERRMAAIQRSTHSDIQWLAGAHNLLRMKWRWYYKWHTLKSSNATHYLSLAVIMLVILFKIYGAYQQ